jgi:hypothetical protein
MDQSDLNRLGTFLGSEYFNTRPQITNLYAIIRNQFGKDSETKEISKREIYNQLFQADISEADYTELEDKHLRKVFSDLMRMVKQYLVIEEFQKDEIAEISYLTKGMHGLGLTDFHKKTVQNFRNSFPLQRAGAHGLIHHHIIDDEEYKFLQSTSPGKIIELPGKSLDLYYVVEKLKLLCEKYITADTRGKSQTVCFEPEIEELASSPLFETYPIVSFYRTLLGLFKGTLSENIEDIAEMLIGGVAIIEREELFQMFNYFQNYCIKRLNQGIDDSRVLMRLYLARIPLASVLYPIDLQNMVSVAIKHGTTDDAEEIFAIGINKVPEIDRPNAKYFNQAHISLATSNFQDVRKSLRAIDFKKFADEFSVKVLEIKSFWEEGEEEFALTKVANLIAYLKRMKNVSGERRKNHVRRFKFYESIMKARYNPEKLNSLKLEIESRNSGQDSKYQLERIEYYLA